MTTATADILVPRPYALRPPRVEPIETLLTIVALVIMVGMFRGVLNINYTSEISREAGSGFIQLINTAVFGSGLALLLLRGVTETLWRVLIRSWPLLLLLGFALLSTIWSDSHSTSFRRAIALILSTSFAYYIVARYRIEDFVKVLGLVFVLYLVIGTAAVLVPGQGITPNGPFVGAWRGFTGMKNEFGRILSYAAAAFFICRVIQHPHWSRWWAPLMAFALALLWLSESRTSLVCTVAAIGGALFLRLVFHPRVGPVHFSTGIRSTFGIVTLLIILAFVGIALPLIVEALGKDLTLSGRTKLWEWAAEIGMDRPWLGSGFRAFWIDENTKYFSEFFFWQVDETGKAADESFTGPANGHSGYLDVWLELGFAGAVLFVGFMTSLVFRIARSFAMGGWTAAYFLAATFSFLLVYSITERVTLEHTEGIWFLVSVFYLYADRELAFENALAGRLPG